MVPTPSVHLELRHRLEKVMRRICPPWLAGELEDLVQAAQMKLLGREEGVDQLATAYLYRVAHSVMVDEMRRRKKRQEVDVDPQKCREAVAEAEIGPEDRTAGLELGAAIHACLGELKPEFKVAVALHLQGHSVPDIAGLLGHNRKKAENLVYRGLNELRELLRQRGLEP